jgi:signal transduction histidine kinase
MRLMPIPPSEEAKWPRLLSLSVHEFRTPMTVVAGYIRMLLKDRAGPLSDQQRRLLAEAEKSCARLSALLVEMSDLANLEAGTATFNRSAVDLRGVLADAIASLPPWGDHQVEIALTTSNGQASVRGDPVRLKTAFSSLLYALRRELGATDRLFVKEREGEFRGKPASWVAIGDAEHIGELESATSESLTTFDEWRGGCGLSLAVARRIIDGHGGAMWSPGQGTKAGAVVALPRT